MLVQSEKICKKYLASYSSYRFKMKYDSVVKGRMPLQNTCQFYVAIQIEKD